MKKKDKILITELFMAKCGLKGWGRCFHGTIRREKDAHGNPIVCSKISMHEGYHYDPIEETWIREKKPVITGFIYAIAEDQWKLGEILDEMVLMILDYDIHESLNKNIDIASTRIFLN